MITHDTPWPYITIDDLLEQEFVDQLKSYGQKCIQENRYGLHYIPKSVNFDGYGKFSSTIQDLLPDFLAHFTQRRSFQTLEYQCHLAVQPAGYTYPPHCDHPAKVITMVTYISPGVSHGTRIHADNSDNVIAEVDWRSNRTLIFAGINDVTWHSYISGSQPRVALCGFFLADGYDPT